MKDILIILSIGLFLASWGKLSLNLLVMNKVGRIFYIVD